MKRVIRRIFSVVTFMIVPYSDKRPIRIRVPVIIILLLSFVWVSFTGYIVSLGITTQKYFDLKKRLDFYEEAFLDINSTIRSLKQAEADFRRLFSLKKKEEIYAALDTTDTGAIDIELIKKQIEKTMAEIGEIRDYLRKERDIYFATPMGMPVQNGYISSPFGWRIHPKTHKRDFHTGVDIASWPGTPVRATADGIVVFAGWSGESGKLVVIEHGFGYTTCYAHNKKILVRVGQVVRRGDVIAYVGSTGRVTGPHVHYEVWVDKKPVNPMTYLRRMNVGKESGQG